MKRFQTDRRANMPKNFILSVLIFLFFIVSFSYGIQSVSKTADRTELETLENAVRRNIVHCYATEGRYPESLEYLEDHYALRYDKNKYFIGYEVQGENIMPYITIIPKTKSN